MPEETAYVGQDREIRFDVSLSFLSVKKGEFEIDAIDGIEDTKGNNGDRGILTVTNLRIVWQNARNSKINLSIGFNCISSISIKTATSRIRGHTQALFVLTRYNGSRFEFIFTNLVKDSPRLFSTVQSVLRAYETSKLYRDLKLRGAIIQENELKVLPKENIYSRVEGVWNLSSDQGNLGTLYVTNCRIVWFANMAQNFNVSIPYLQIRSVLVRDSKFGLALVVETSPNSGSYILGFKIDPEDRLEQIHTEISRLHRLFTTNPIFGVEYSVEEQPQSLKDLKVPKQSEDIDILDEGDDLAAFSAYYADSNKHSDREPVYSNEIGLAVESVREGMTLDTLWNSV
eukprot:gb/GECH01013118.1/.p1 GENE.gb/GECH01013118.1/~~gb/GECH01013118.1/.p1  ORF type:complete len:343 (+),score=62.42 gb/GECH01013118.1/:1-1029(+)